MILHIAPDSRFLEMAYEEFEEVAPGKNKFVVISRSKHLKTSKKKDVIACKPHKLCSKAMFDLAKSCDAIFIHYLSYHSALFISSLKFKKKILWLGWGGDYQFLIKESVHSENLLPETISLCNQMKTLKSLLWDLLILVRDLWWQKSRVFKRAVEKIDFFAPVLPNEYDLLKSRLKYFNASFVSWNYGTLQDFIPCDSLFWGNDVLVGNSATPSNNHIDAFRVLKKAGFAGRVIAPLNYGDVRYAKTIDEVGTQMFGENFLPILQPLPLEEYSNLIKTCSFVIMNQIRQQAVGNIVLMLHSGASVFFQRESPVYVYLKAIGAHVFEISDILQTREIGTLRLTSLEIDTNRRLVSQIFGFSNKRKRTLELLDMLKLL